ncbi:hypothetical protein [Nitrobacter winogradskyi]|uniref:Transmembrane protein n=2 Tax=Nitrobacter winogradskyi TaxID=913 RepID=A0A4Y3W8F6_NITWI|nr:hypothetical protein [Nitrobacter winogradskyi]MCP1997783.1 hypothetical protein [Nitrobacter winogradskyi]GEC14788.1 hypothetical protein NWI01_06800 [Nitrobacter winogradskyi]
MEAPWAWIAAAIIPILLLAPAIWNGYPLLQHDTGGYLARWYESHLEISRSNAYGIYLHLGQGSYFWINLACQALLTLWILHLTLRVLNMAQPLRLLTIALILITATALPWLASMLLTDIFAGLAVLALYILVVHNGKLSIAEKISLFLFTSFAAASHTATFGVLLGLCCAGWIVKPLLGPRLQVGGLVQGSLTIVTGAAMLLAANFMLTGQLTWTPGGAAVSFGRMMQDGIVARYLNDHCDKIKLKLCPYRDQLPATADDFLWGNDSIFDKLGRFEGLNGEMEFIATHALVAYPLWQAEAAVEATAEQLVSVDTGEGNTGWIPHTYGIIERYLPEQVKVMRAARQQHWNMKFTAINWIHVPVALASMLLLAAIALAALWRRRLDDVDLLAATVTVALLGNAFICGVLSGPHDRYGARMVWVATFVVLIAAARSLANRYGPLYGRRDKNFSTPSL